MTHTVGRWRFLYDDEMRAHWEERLRADRALSAEALPGVGDLASALQAITAEAELASLEIDARGELCSLVGDAPVYRARLRVEDGELCFDKPGGVRVTLMLSERGELVADEPGKPPMRFRRVEPTSTS